MAKPEPTVVFTANMSLPLSEAERLKKLLDEAAIKGNGHWGYNELGVR